MSLEGPPSVFILRSEYDYLLQIVRARGTLIRNPLSADFVRARYLERKGLVALDGDWVSATALGVALSQLPFRSAAFGTAVMVELGPDGELPEVVGPACSQWDAGGHRDSSFRRP
ncbi:hypothetical protein VT03_03625 [Planctomyces sp. SH-PL14]|nr:hypothetical protein VT03_03625 [Planctomyces sp. SH-PL14]